MANFNEAYGITMCNEGGYCNTPGDHGGETWCGVARNFWKHWPGWSIVDEIKLSQPASLNHALVGNNELKQLVADFYKENFWDCLSLDDLSCQQIANQLFDIAVNMGGGTAAKMFQNAINALTDNSIEVDGKVGHKTLAAANNLNDESLYNEISNHRKKRYEDIIAKNPSQAKFRNTWFNRMKPFEVSSAQNNMA